MPKEDKTKSKIISSKDITPGLEITVGNSTLTVGEPILSNRNF